MLVPRLFGLTVTIVTMVCGVGAVSGQAYPNKTIRIYTSEAGGGSDLAARLIAQGISAPLGQPVIVENRAGIIANELGAKAAPDGYTLLFSASLWIGPLFQPELPWDPVKDFATVSLATSAPNLLVVHPSLPAKSVAALITLAKARSGELNYATGSTGSTTHLAAEIFKSMAGVHMVRIPYKGTGPAINALVAGDVQLMISTPGGAASLVKAGRLRALAVTSARPSALFPELPTVAASVAGYESISMAGVFAPAKTPEAIVNRLNQEIVQVLNRAEVKEKLLNIGVEATPSSAEKWAALIKTEMTAVGKVIQDSGLRAK